MVGGCKTKVKKKKMGEGGWFMKPGLGESQNRVQLGGGGLSAFDFWPEFYLPPTDVFSSPPLCLCAVVGNLTVPGISAGKLPGACVGTLQGPYKTAICRNFAYASSRNFFLGITTAPIC